MLFFDIEGYEDFKSLFPIREEGGVSRRVNKVLLSLYKSKAHLHQLRLRKENREYDRDYVVLPDRHLSLESLVSKMWRELHYPCNCTDDCFGRWQFFDHDTICAPNMYPDEYKGLCVDNDENSIRYRNGDNKVYKMKAGKFIRKCIEANNCTKVLPEQIKVYFCEEFAREWKAYAAPLQKKNLQLVVDYDFESIYDSDNYVCDFGSCMQNEGQYSFYNDAVEAEAASLRNGDGLIMARCVIFTKVRDDDTGEVLRLAERQYGEDEVSKQILVDMLISGGHIDGYKAFGASCWDTCRYVSNDGECWSNRRFSIECNLDDGDTMSFQDSFAGYSLDNHRAYNYKSADFKLDVTDGYFHCGKWSDWHDCYIDEDEAVWSEDRGSYLYDNEVVWSAHEHDYLLEEDVVYVEGRDDYYRDNDDDLCEPADSSGYYDVNDVFYSDLLEDYYVDEDTMHDDEEDYAERHNLVRNEYGEWVEKEEKVDA